MKKSIILLVFSLFSIFSNAQSLDVMTYNIRLDVAVDGENAWPLRKEYFISQIQYYEPDIFGIQEAKPNQVVDISNGLSQYSQVGIGREGEGKGESSNIFYKKDRFLLKESSTFWLSETPNIISKGWDAAFNRVCTYALFKDKKTKKNLWVFNTHLDHLGEVARTKGIELILSKIAEVNTKKYPVIFMGDFNSEPTMERIISLKKQMNDCREISEEKPFGPSGTFNGFNHNEPVTLLIDYIFVSKNNKLIVKKYAVLSDSKELKYPSDHLPVYVKLNYTNEK
ncbi:MAG: endonuclease/exonuclease/phosphatase [Bacteroidetes bacterium HGW-Bacteroidetes-3]|nr:MAG: endonuclease/exonuclease/phosphatase [Bacteroidetes bacterium HGW-Bacteroidetes-3]